VGTTQGPPRAPAEGLADLRIEQRPVSHPDAQLLVEAVQQEYVVRYGGRDRTPMVASELAPPSGAFYVGYRDGMPVMTGAWRFRDDVQRLGSARPAEVKRMYVEPASRGSGVAAALLRSLEEAARARGWTTLRLETGPAQPEAIRFYEREGYRSIPLYGAYVGSDLSLCYERAL